MSTRFLFKPFLTFTLIALLLLPQIEETGTALAAKPTPVSLAIPGPRICLSVNNTTGGYGRIVPVANPPGEEVEFTINFDVENNCTLTVGNIIVGGPFQGTCAEGTINLVKDAFLVRGNLASGQHVGEPRKYTAYCYNSADDSSEVPTGISMSISAAGIDTNGASVVSPAIPFTVIWSPSVHKKQKGVKHGTR